MDLASAGATYSLPTTNRINGPKLQAAGAPTMYRFGTLVSKPGESRGYPST